MKSSSKIGNSAFRKLQQDRQDNQKHRIALIGVLVGVLLTAVALFGASGAEDTSAEMPASGLEIVSDDAESAVNAHPITRYAAGRSIEEMDRLIEDSSTSK